MNSEEKREQLKTELECYPLMLTPKDVSKIIRVTQRTVYSYLNEKKLPFTVIMGKRLIFKTDLINMLAEGGN